MEIRPGMIGMSGGNSFIQKAIRFFTKSDFSHSFPISIGFEGVLSTFETTSTIVSSVPIEHKLAEPDWIELWEPICSEDIRRQALKEVYKEYAGTWYGYLSYLWFMYRWLIRKFGKEPKHVWSWADNNVTCTELTCYYIAKLGPEFAALFSDLDYSAQSPEELIIIMKSNPHLFKRIGWLKEK